MLTVLRFRAAAARKIDAPSVTNCLSRSFSSSVQGAFIDLMPYRPNSMTPNKKTAVPIQITTTAFLSEI
jgi:hypothetical protein